MSNAWISIPLEDYEGHMNAPGVGQLTVLAELFRRVLDLCRPESVAVLGVAGGNGLGEIDGAVTTRVVGVDINERYLDEVRQRFGDGVELHCVDLAEPGLGIAPVALVHAALIFEHVGLEPALDNALSLVAGGGRLSVVLQLPSTEAEGVAATGYTSLQALKPHFALIDRGVFAQRLEGKGFRLTEEELRPVAAGKALWLGVFEQGA